jgi:hypothetical protein
MLIVSERERFGGVVWPFLLPSFLHASSIFLIVSVLGSFFVFFSYMLLVPDVFFPSFSIIVSIPCFLKLALQPFDISFITKVSASVQSSFFLHCCFYSHLWETDTPAAQYSFDAKVSAPVQNAPRL